MSKGWVFIAASMIAVNVFSSEVLEKWEFNDSSSVTLSKMKNTGSLSSRFDGGELAKWHTDNLGSLVVQGGAGTAWRAGNRYAPGVFSPTDIYSLEMKIASLSIGDGTQRDVLKFCIKDSDKQGVLEIQLRLGSEGGARIVFSSARSRYKTYPISKDAPISARLDFNIEKGTVIYYLNGQVADSFKGVVIEDLQQLGLSREGLWTQPDTSVYIGELSLSRKRAPVSVSSDDSIGKVNQYGQWAQDYGIKTTTGSDYDADGLEDLFEYALGSNPLEKDIESVLPRLKRIEYQGLHEDAYVFRRRIGYEDQGLIYLPEVRFSDASQPTEVGEIIRTERIDADFEYAFVIVPEGGSVQLRIKIQD